MLSQLEKSILATLAYFDIFDYPLTCLEIHKYLLSPKGEKIKSGLYETKHILETSSTLAKKIQSRQGFYFLRNRQNIINIRKQRYIIAEKKFKKAKKYLNLLSKIPFVKKIYICNSLAYNNARDESDIDLALFCEKNTLWLCRFLAIFLMEALGQRPTETDMRNKICLSFYLDENELNLEKYQSECPDIHFIYWQSQFLPLFGEKSSDFFQKNSWIKNYLANHLPQSINNRRKIQKSKQKNKSQRKFFHLIKKYLNQKTKKYQLKIMPAKLTISEKEPNTNVVLKNQIIKLHSNDKRQEFNQIWRIKYKSMLKFYENFEKNN